MLMYQQSNSGGYLSGAYDSNIFRDLADSRYYSNDSSSQNAIEQFFGGLIPQDYRDQWTIPADEAEVLKAHTEELKAFNVTLNNSGLLVGDASTIDLPGLYAWMTKTADVMKYTTQDGYIASLYRGIEKTNPTTDILDIPQYTDL